LALTEITNQHCLVEDCWLSDILRYKVFRAVVPSVTQPISADELSRHARLQSRAMYYAKVDTSQVTVLKELESAGMNVVDVNIALSCDIRFQPLANRSTCIVKEATAADEGPITAMAGSCFRYSRFHLDPELANETANQIKHNWVKSYFHGQRGDRLFVAWYEGVPAGFLAALVTDEKAVVDLVGVDRRFQRCGIGSSLMETFCKHYQNHCTALQVGTQVSNTPSLRFYRKFGFDISGSSYVLHMHV
jgi:ribosomal protein S18 acetylase RimI-like enzyme